MAERPMSSYPSFRAHLFSATASGANGLDYGVQSAECRRERLSILQAQAVLWSEHRCCDDLLLRGEALAQAEEWAATRAESLADAERDLLEESQQARLSGERMRRRGRLIEVVAAAMLLVCLVLTHQALKAQRENAVQAGARDAMEAQLASAAAAREVAWAAATAEAQARVRAEIARAQAQDSKLQELDRSRRAESSALAAWAYSLVETEPQLALLLALESLRRARGNEALGAASAAIPPGLAGTALYHAIGYARWESAFAPGEVYRSAWKASDGRVVGATPDGQLCVWDAATGARLARLGPVHSDILHVAWSRDGQRIATSHRGGEAIIWDSVTGERLQVLNGHSGWVLFSSWSEDGQSIVTCGGEGRAIVWDAATGGQRLTLAGPAGNLVGAEWRSNDSELTTYYDDGSPAVWSSLDGSRLSIGRAVDPERPVESPRAGGERLVVAHVAGKDSVRVANMDYLVALACSKAGRNMTQDEWDLYVDPTEPYRKTCTRLP